MAAPCAAVALAPGATAGARPFAAPASSWSSTTARHGPDALRTPAAHAQGGQDDAQRDGAANGCKKVRSVGGERVEVGNGARDFAERHAARERAAPHHLGRPDQDLLAATHQHEAQQILGGAHGPPAGEIERGVRREGSGDGMAVHGKRPRGGPSYARRLKRRAARREGPTTTQPPQNCTAPTPPPPSAPPPLTASPGHARSAGVFRLSLSPPPPHPVPPSPHLKLVNSPSAAPAPSTADPAARPPPTYVAARLEQLRRDIDSTRASIAARDPALASPPAAPSPPASPPPPDAFDAPDDAFDAPDDGPGAAAAEVAGPAVEYGPYLTRAEARRRVGLLCHDGKFWSPAWPPTDWGCSTRRELQVQWAAGELRQGWRPAVGGQGRATPPGVDEGERYYFHPGSSQVYLQPPRPSDPFAVRGAPREPPPNRAPFGPKREAKRDRRARQAQAQGLCSANASGPRWPRKRGARPPSPR